MPAPVLGRSHESKIFSTFPGFPGTTKATATQQEVFGACFGKYWWSGFFVSATGPLILFLSKNLGVKPSSLGVIGTLYGICLLLNGLVAKTYLKQGPIWMLRLYPLIMTAGVALALWCPNLPTVMVGLFLMAFASAAIATLIPATFLGRTGLRYLTLSNAAYSVCTVLATLAASAITLTVLPNRFVLALVIIPVIWTWLATLSLPAPAFTSWLRDWLGIFSQHRNKPQLPPQQRVLLRWQLLRIVLAVGPELVFYAWGAMRLSNAGATLGLTSFLSTAYVLGMAVGRYVGAPIVNRYATFYYCLVTAIVGTILVAFAPWPWLITVGLALAGLGISCLYPICASEATSIEGLDPARIAGTISVLGGLGGLLLPAALNLLTLIIPLWMGFLVVLVFLVPLLFIPRAHH